MSRILSLITEYKVMSALIGGTVALDAAYYGLYNWIQSYRAFRVSRTEQDSSTEMRRVSQDLRDSLRAAGEKLGLERRLLDRVRLFVCRGIDPVRMGQLSMAGLDSFLGLPEHFDFKPTDVEQRHSFFFDDRTLSLNTSKGRQLYRDTLVLNDDEKGFVLARELLYLTSNAVHAPPIAGTLASAGLGGLFYWGIYGKGKALFDSAMTKSKMSGVSKHIPKFYILGLIIAPIVWSMMAYQWHAAYRKSLDARVDSKAAAAFPNGAATFYQKQVKRNTLLRAMLGENIGKGYYTVKGNEVKNWILSDPFLPVNQRWSKLRYNQSIAAEVAKQQSAAAE